MKEVSAYGCRLPCMLSGVQKVDHFDVSAYLLNQFNENAESFTLGIQLVHDCALKMFWKLTLVILPHV